MTDAHPNPEAVCRKCGGPNVTWYAPSPLWNAVMDYPHERFGGIICPTCFCILAAERGLTNGFRVSSSQEPTGVSLVHTDGRVWNAETDLWAEPAPAPADPPMPCDRAAGCTCGKHPDGAGAVPHSTPDGVPA